MINIVKKELEFDDELKKKIEDNDLGDNFFVFQLQDESS